MKQLMKIQGRRSFANAAKKSFALMGMLLVFGLYSFAGINGAKERAENNFEKVFKNATNVSWNLSGDFLQASCYLDGKATHVFYDANGDYLCLTREIAYDELPVYAKKYISEKLEGFEPAETISFTSKDAGDSFYCSLVKDGKKKILKISNDASIGISVL